MTTETQILCALLMAYREHDLHQIRILNRRLAQIRKGNLQ